MIEVDARRNGVRVGCTDWENIPRYAVTEFGVAVYFSTLRPAATPVHQRTPINSMSTYIWMTHVPGTPFNVTEYNAEVHRTAAIPSAWAPACSSIAGALIARMFRSVLSALIKSMLMRTVSPWTTTPLDARVLDALCSAPLMFANESMCRDLSRAWSPTSAWSACGNSTEITITSTWPGTTESSNHHTRAGRHGVSLF